MFFVLSGNSSYNMELFFYHEIFLVVVKVNDYYWFLLIYWCIIYVLTYSAYFSYHLDGVKTTPTSAQCWACCNSGNICQYAFGSDFPLHLYPEITKIVCSNQWHWSFKFCWQSHPSSNWCCKNSTLGRRLKGFPSRVFTLGIYLHI